jgi:hypothetical protein
LVSFSSSFFLVTFLFAILIIVRFAVFVSNTNIEKST